MLCLIEKPTLPTINIIFMLIVFIEWHVQKCALVHLIFDYSIGLVHRPYQFIRLPPTHLTCLRRHYFACSDLNGVLRCRWSLCCCGGCRSGGCAENADDSFDATGCVTRNVSSRPRENTRSLYSVRCRCGSHPPSRHSHCISNSHWYSIRHVSTKPRALTASVQTMRLTLLLLRSNRVVQRRPSPKPITMTCNHTAYL